MADTNSIETRSRRVMESGNKTLATPEDAFKPPLSALFHTHVCCYRKMNASKGLLKIIPDQNLKSDTI